MSMPEVVEFNGTQPVFIRVNPYYYLAECSHAAQIFPRRPRSRPRPRLGVWARLRGRGGRRGRFGCGCATPCSSVVGSYWLRLRRAAEFGAWELGISGFSTRVRSRNFAALSPMPTVYIKTYGCQMNERDSEAVAAQLVAKGYTLAPSEHVADVVLLNTCSVRDLAEQKALNKMENLAADIRRSRPHVVLGFRGCMAESRGQELIDRLPDVDLVVGTQKFHRTADYLDDIFAGRRDKVVEVEEEKGSEAAIKEHLLHGAGAANGVPRPPA